MIKTMTMMAVTIEHTTQSINNMADEQVKETSDLPVEEEQKETPMEMELTAPAETEEPAAAAAPPAEPPAEDATVPAAAPEPTAPEAAPEAQALPDADVASATEAVAKIEEPEAAEGKERDAAAAAAENGTGETPADNDSQEESAKEAVAENVEVTRPPRFLSLFVNGEELMTAGRSKWQWGRSDIRHF
ncbi:PREDICTED: major latex allergen Hev b 5-like [Priapulus caudatus]|uniref:Major latex allergen Hev b 5-like n=1 Tax=Priapulus caudatus TaxID=37621 RepID=A0ABM1EYH9_PRICU|nr:PREDICTED: major latex allergen Hev b 5-like [Priapulus caudatus]